MVSKALDNMTWITTANFLIRDRAHGRCELCGEYYGIDSKLLQGHHRKNRKQFASRKEFQSKENIVITCYQCYRKHIYDGSDESAYLEQHRQSNRQLKKVNRTWLKFRRKTIRKMKSR